MGTKFLIGDTVIAESGILYKVITINGKASVGDEAEFQIYGSIRMRSKNFLMPDRRFMYIKTTKDVIRRFTIFPLFENEITLYRRVVGEKTEESIPEKKKFIYPGVKILLELDCAPKSTSLSLETYIRLKYRGKYYLAKVSKSFDIKPGIEREIEIITLIQHFYVETYRYQKLMKVDLKMVMPQNMDKPKPVFELDTDQTPEEERLIPKI